MYIREKTKTVTEKLLRLQRQEEKQARLMAESLSSTVNHELQTPIDTIILLVSEIKQKFLTNFEPIK